MSAALNDADTGTELAGLGHNNPPAPLTAIEVRAYLADAKAPLVERKDALMAGVARFLEKHSVIADEETQSRAGDFVKQIAAHAKIVEDHRTPAKKPFLDSGRAVDAFFKDIADPLAQGIAKIRAPMTVWAQKQEAIRRAKADQEAAEARQRAREAAEALAKQQAEEAEREEARRRSEYVPPAPVEAPPPVSLDEVIAISKEAEALTRAAEAKPADFSRTRGEFGSVSSLRQIVTVEMVDIALVPREFLLFNESAAKRAAQANEGLVIPGVKINRTSGIATR